MSNLIVLDGKVVEVIDVNDFGYGKDIDCNNGCEYKVFLDHEEAGEKAQEYWEDMANNDKEKFKCLVGTDNLISWCLGECAGTEKVESLEEWLDLWLDTPEEQWATYDGEEIEGIQCNKNLLVELDMEDEDKSFIVMYRTN